MGMFYNDDGKPKGLFGGVIDFAKSDYGTGLAGSLSRGQGLGQAHMFGSGYEKSIKDEKFRRHQQAKLDAFHKEIAEDKADRAERDSKITNMVKIQALNKEVKKRTFRGVDGKHYYEGGEAVLPNVQAQEKPKDDKAFANIANLRKQFENGSGEFIKSRDAYSRIQASATDPSAAGDLALIFNYMKVLDPGSTVREGEFATAQSAAGVSERVRGLYNSISNGQRLTVEQRQDFLKRAGMLFTKQSNSYQNRVDEFSRITTSFGYDPSQVIIDHRGNVKAAQPENTPPKTINFEDLN